MNEQARKKANNKCRNPPLRRSCPSWSTPRRRKAEAWELEVASLEGADLEVADEQAVANKQAVGGQEMDGQDMDGQAAGVGLEGGSRKKDELEAGGVLEKGLGVRWSRRTAPCTTGTCGTTRPPVGQEQRELSCR